VAVLALAAASGDGSPTELTDDGKSGTVDDEGAPEAWISGDVAAADIFSLGLGARRGCAKTNETATARATPATAMSAIAFRRL
jgi:hypothetical protein